MPSSIPRPGKSLAEINPAVAAEWHPSKNGSLTPFDVMPVSRKNAWWKCPVADDHEWKSPITNRTNMKTRCPCCSGRKVVKSNCLATTRSDIVLQWHLAKNVKLTPYDVTAYSHKKAWWQCPFGYDHEWESTIANRTNGKGCPCCWGVKVVESNCLATLRPDVAAEWHPNKNESLTPWNVVKASNRKIWWQCPVGHEWKASITNRTRRGSGCPVCNESKGEKAVVEVLDGLGVLYNREFRFDNCKNIKKLPFDFLVVASIPPRAGLIEFHGKQHYEPIEFYGGIEGFKMRRKLDQIKEKFCKETNLPLLVIPYTDLANVKQRVEDFIGDLAVRP